MPAYSQSYTALRRTRTPTANYLDEKYQLQGVNLSTPDDLIADGEATQALNCRMYARELNAKRVAIKTRKGPGHYSSPVGGTLDQQQIVTTGAADKPLNQANWLAQSFTPTATGMLNSIDLNLKQNTGTGTIIVHIHSNSGSAPGAVIATSGNPGSSVSSAYAYVRFRFINPAAITAGTTYWVSVSAQDDNVNFYNISSTTAATTAVTSNTSGNSWSSTTFALNFKQYYAPQTPVLGTYRRYGNNGTNITILAVGTALYSVDDTTGATTVIKSGLSSNATVYRFETFNDHTIIVNGFDNAMTYDGTTVTTLSSLPFVPNNVKAHKNRLFFTTSTDPNRVFYSDITDETSYPSANFFYVPSPKPADPISAMHVFQDYLVVFTHNHKYVISGDNVANFTQRQSIGTKGTPIQEASATDGRNFIYFMSTDGGYRWNGSSDQIITDKVQPEIGNIANFNSVTTIIWNNQWRVYYPSGASAVSNAMLLYDEIYSQWFMDDNVYCTHPVVFDKDIGQPLVESSSIIGALYYAEVAYSSLGAPINFKYWTAYNKYLSAGAKDRVKVFRPLIRPSGYTYIMQIGKDINFANAPFMQPYTVTSVGATWGGGYTWGAASTKPAIWGTSGYSDTKASMSGRGKHTQYRFERLGANTPVELYGYMALIKTSRIS